ncbi:DoxX family protein [Bacteroidales bacterium OttesenSCG-928-B11]|nr:DoxX family protein [Bacteroidales bacterium OttesenSCG-928-E04]MDL2308777.1 DoxX family protein [Bacteroidales bacterium OttesenSCG-928-C03]MDL2312660.1 DoxX family protein [Bacteroidales bacterium OttesenSCG-928-B11]MDL2326089.1 DoxX family protein [Bacteroidales bacterium OttesenSCG-928-A14]
MNRKEPVWIMILRILLAGVFLFSGFTKAIDPVGSAIQFDEYFTSFGMGFLHPISMFCAFAMNILEFTMGFMMLFRIKIKLTSLGYLLFMSFFFLLTAWLAIAEHLEVNYDYDFGVVKDCGCFGAAIKMNNLETFLKNVVIIIPTIIIFVKRKTIPAIRLTELGQWCFACVGGFIVLFLQIYCYRHLPIIDFSEWKKETDLVIQYIEQPGEKEMIFIYQSKRDSSVINLTVEDMETVADSNPNFYDEYEYVDRIDSLVKAPVKPKLPGFNMLDANGKDHANLLINRDNLTPLFLLVMPNVDDANGKAFADPNLQEIIKRSEENNLYFVGITNSTQEEVAAFTAKHNLSFPIYSNPIDPVKGPFMVRDAIRSNPGLFLIERGFIKDKWAWRDIPPYMITN